MKHTSVILAFVVLSAVVGCSPSGPAPAPQDEAAPTAAPSTAIDFENGTVDPATQGAAEGAASEESPIPTAIDGSSGE
jgi:hypothetical protein